MVSENVFLLYSLLLGIMMTLVYDLFRILRRVFLHHKFLISIEDLIFWFGCGITVFLVMQKESNGVLRWFSIVGALFGMFIYRQLLGKFLVDFLSGILIRVKKFFYKPIHIFIKKSFKVRKYIKNCIDRVGIYLKNRLTSFWKTIIMILCKQ